MLVVLSADAGTEMKDNLLRSVARVGWPQERIPLEQIIITLLKPPLWCSPAEVPHTQETVQGYLTYKKPTPPRTLPWAYA